MGNGKRKRRSGDRDVGKEERRESGNEGGREGGRKEKE